MRSLLIRPWSFDAGGLLGAHVAQQLMNHVERHALQFVLDCTRAGNAVCGDILRPPFLCGFLSTCPACKAVYGLLTACCMYRCCSAGIACAQAIVESPDSSCRICDNVITKGYTMWLHAAARPIIGPTCIHYDIDWLSLAGISSLSRCCRIEANTRWDDKLLVTMWHYLVLPPT
jgi:hypothetical protein